MIRTFQLDHVSQARVWQDEDPFDSSVRTASIVIELLAPRGPRTEYGLLGASIRTGYEGGSTVECLEDEGLWRESVAVGIDEVRRGLPREYRDIVQQASARAMAGRSIEGAIVFNWAAHGAIGSSPAMFGRLAVAVVAMLANRRGLTDDDYVRQLLEVARHP